MEWKNIGVDTERPTTSLENNRDTHLMDGGPTREGAQPMSRRTLPNQCDYCGSIGYVALNVSTRGGRVALWWHCRACEGEWPTNYDELEEGRADPADRRSGPADRRRCTRRDRRLR
jgi:hypothetical protein